MHYFKPKKYLGQNFLKDANIVKKIIRHAKLRPNDLVIEVGPGLGILTKELAKHCRKVIAIEIDNNLIPLAKANLKGVKNVEIIKGDALEFAPPKEPYKIVANIPYSISSPLLNHFIKDQFDGRDKRPPVTCTLMLQKEVAQKLCAAPPKMNVLALHVQPFGEPKYLFKVNKNAFSPVPKVDSAIVRIEIFEEPKIKNIKTYLDLVHAGFSKKRKQLWNSLASAISEGNKRKFMFESAKIHPERRAETLSLNEWQRLARALERMPQMRLF